MIVALSLCNAAHFYAICSIFSYAGFLAVDKGWSVHVDEAGYVAGLLPTFLMAGRLSTAILWGFAMTRFGTAACLSASMASVAIGNLLFGFARELWQALAARTILLGAGNGFASIMGLAMFEISGERQADVVSIFLTVGGIVNLVGPAIGGFTYAAFGKEDFPALPPSLIGAALAVSASIVAYSWFRPPAHTQRIGDRNTNDAGTPSPRAAPPATSAWHLMLCTQMLRVVIVRTGIGLAIFAVFEVFPLWAIASETVGGLGLDEHALGTLLSLSALMQLVYTGIFMGQVVKHMGEAKAIQLGSLVAAVALTFIPFLRMLPPTVVRVILAAILHSISQCAMLTSTTGALAGANHEFERYPELKGTLNGLVATIEGVGKLLGPALAAPLFAALVGARPMFVCADEATENGSGQLSGDDGPGCGRFQYPTIEQIIGSGAFLSFAVLALGLLLLATYALALPTTISRAKDAPCSTSTVSSAASCTTSTSGASRHQASAELTPSFSRTAEAERV